MQCAATLSWSIFGNGFPSGIAKGEAKRIARDDAPPQPASGRQRGAQPVSAQAAGVLGRRMESSFEVDGIQLVRRCLDGDSGAWA